MYLIRIISYMNQAKYVQARYQYHINGSLLLTYIYTRLSIANMNKPCGYTTVYISTEVPNFFYSSKR